jgi:hypothetical protein
MTFLMLKVTIVVEYTYRGMSSSVESAPTEGRVKQGGEAERVGIEHARGRQNLVREVDEPVLVGPLAVGVHRKRAIQEIGGCPASSARGGLFEHLILCGLNELDLPVSLSKVEMTSGPPCPPGIEPLLPRHYVRRPAPGAIASIV